MASVPPLERGYVVLQAVVAEAALGDITTAYRRLDDLLDADDNTLLILVRVCVDFVTRMSLSQGYEWTNVTDDDGTPMAIEQRCEPRRVSSLRMLAAWSAGDGDSFEALFLAACVDPDRRREYLRDVFEVTVDKAEILAEQAGNPRTIVAQLCRSILKEGVGSENWNR